MDNPISFQRVKEEAHRLFTDFPMPCFFAFALAVALIYMIIAENMDGAVIYYFTAAYLLSLMLKLWGYETRNRSKFLTISIAAHAILLVDATVLFLRDSNDFETSTFIAHSAVYLALALGICFLPFIREKDDIPSWNFVRSLIFSAVISFVTGGIMAAGFALLLWGVGEIFGINIESKCYAIVVTLFLQLLPMSLFLSRIPKDEERHNHQPFVSGFLNGITRYLFIPLICCYIVVLYVHLFIILFTWSLPNGTVSLLVTAMMCGTITIEFLLYPTIQSGAAKRFETLIVRWLPVIALPLVALMTVGIVRRFDDYGVTANRLYMLTLNIWFYGVCIGLFLTRARRIHWVSLSFCALLLLTSAHPFNYYELVRMSMTVKVQKIIEKYPPAQLPIKGKDKLKKWLETLPKDEQASTYSLMSYLVRNYSHKYSDTWVKGVYFYNYDNDFADVKYTREVLFEPMYEYDESIVPIPDGYSRMQHLYRNESIPLEQAIKGDSIILPAKYIGDSLKSDFIISRQALKSHQKSHKTPLFINTAGTAAILPHQLHIEADSTDIHISGSYYLFLK